MCITAIVIGFVIGGITGFTIAILAVAAGRIDDTEQLLCESHKEER